MDPDLKKVYARSIDTPAGKCFCLVMLGPDSEGDGFDVTVFHARSLRTYVGKSLRAPPRWIKPDLWMPLALRALASEAAPEGVRFNFNPDTGALSWTWPAKDVGMSAGAQQAVMLRRVEPGAEAGACAGGGGGGGEGASGSASYGSYPLEDMMATVWESCYRLMLSCRQLDSQLQRQSACLISTRRELQECTERHKSLVQELHVKFARVLDAKKDKLIEQQARIRELEEQLDAAKRELGEAEAAQTDEEAEADVDEDPEASEHRRQQQQQRQPDDEDGLLRTRLASHPRTSAAAVDGQVVQPDREQPNGRNAGGDAGRPELAATASPPPPSLTLSRQRTPPPAGLGAATGAAVRQVPAGPVDDMDWDMGDKGPDVGGFRAQAAAAAAAAAFGPMATLGGIYASLGSTQIDDELMMAETQPAMRVAPLSVSGQQLQQLQQPLPQQLQPGQGTVLQPFPAVSRGGGGGAAPRTLESGQPGQQVAPMATEVYRAGPSGRDRPSCTIGETHRKNGCEHEDLDAEEEEDEEDDDAALGLVGRRPVAGW